MGFIDLFKRPFAQHVSTWQELGRYNAKFYNFGGDIYKSDLVRACIRPLAEFTGKAHAKCSDERIERLLNNRPNMYMNGREFLQKVRTLYERNNNCFILVDRDDRGKVISFYPVPYRAFEALNYNDRLYIKFEFENAARHPLCASWDDLAVIRRDFNKSDIAGDDNDALINNLDLIYTTNQGVKNAIKSTANLRGILKNTKGMLSNADIKKAKEDFVKDYMEISNEGGIASLDSTQEFTPITMNPTVASYTQMKEFRENIYRYFGVNDKVTMGAMTSDEIEAFYETKIEPFLVDLSTELQSKIFTQKELAPEYGNFLVYEANKLQFASLTKKIQVFKEVVLNGGMTVNEWRAGCNMAPIDGGDDLIRRLDVGTVDKPAEDEPTEDDPEGDTND